MTVMSTENGIKPYPSLGRHRLITHKDLEDFSMKCSTCGMSKDDNPAHGSDYDGAGKHTFKSASKSLVSLTEDSPIFFGSELKSLGNGKLGGWAVIHSDDASPDLTNDYFDMLTDYFFEGERKAVRPVLYDHGLDATLKSRKLGRATLEIKDAGVWAEIQLNIADAYDAKYIPHIEKMAKDGRLGLSTGSAPHLVQRESVGKAMHMKSWPIVELSITPKPIEPRTKKAMALKSWAEAEKDDVLSDFYESADGVAFKAQIDNAEVEDDEENEDMPHEFEASDDDAEVCEECGDSNEDGNHASKKALEWMKGGIGSGPRPGQQNRLGTGTAGNHLPAGGHKEGDRVKVRGNGGRGAVNGEGKRGEVVSIHDGFVVVEFADGNDASYHESDLHNLKKPNRGDARGQETSRLRAAFVRNTKSLFEEKLAQRTQSVYELDRARDEVFRDIIAAVKTDGVTGVYIDKRQKVTETVTEYAARLIVLVLEQMEKFLDGEYDNTMSSPVGGQTQFYLRSFDGEENPLQAFLSIKSESGVRFPLNEHSSMAVSAVEVYANETAELLEGIKSWIGRCENKIQFRADDKTRSGQLLSAKAIGQLEATLEMLTEAGILIPNLNAKIGELLSTASPQKALDLTGVLTLMLAKHQTDMVNI